MSEHEAGNETVHFVSAGFPFDPPPQSFDEPRSPWWRSWAPIVVVSLLAAVFAAALVLVVLRSGTSSEEASVEQPTSDSTPAAPVGAAASSPSSPDGESVEAAGMSDEPNEPDERDAPEPDEPDERDAPEPTTTTVGTTATSATGQASVTSSTTNGTDSSTSSTTTVTATASSITTVSSTASSTGTVATTDAPGGSGESGAGASFPNPAAASGAAGSGCDPASGPLPDGLWFGRTQQTPNAPAEGFWGEDEIEFDVYCLYGGEAAVRLAASRLDELRPGYDFFAVDDVRGRRTIARAADAQARELLDITGAAGPAVPWAEGLDRFGLIAGNGCCTEGWVRIREGVVVEIAVIQEGGLNYSFPRPRGAQCTDNGLDANPLLMEVGSVPANASNGELALYSDPGLGAQLAGNVPIGTLLNVIHRCEIAADGFGWWMLDWDGRLVWGPGEFLVPYGRG